MIRVVNRKRRKREADRTDVALCRAQVDSLKKTVQFIRAYILRA